MPNNALNEWIKKWTEDNLDADQRGKFKQFASDRLRRGTNAIEVAFLDKLADIRNKEFATQELLDPWLAESRLPEAVKNGLIRRVPTSGDIAKDTVTCLNAADGKMLWKKEYPLAGPA